MATNEEELHNRIVDLECRSEELSYALNVQVERAAQLNRTVRICALKEREAQKVVDSLSEENRELKEKIATLEEKLLQINAG